MRTISSILTIICLLAFTPPAPRGVRWVVLNNILVRVSGSTNVNKFTCEIKNYPNRDTLVCYQHNGTENVRLSGKLEMAVFTFDCLDRIMTHDLRETLKADQHPSLRIALLSLQRYPSLSSGQEQLCGNVAIELAGVTREMSLNLTVTNEDQKTIHMTGSRNIHFTDFGLTPPRKFGGMVRAKDDLTVTFQFNFKVID